MCNQNCRQGRDCDCWQLTQQFEARNDPPPMSRLDALFIAGAIVLAIASAVVMLVPVPVKF